LDGAKLEGEFSARRLWEFVPREGTDLAEAQKVHMNRIRREEGERIEREDGSGQVKREGPREHHNTQCGGDKQE
jgi:hypothetical protein